MALVPDRLIIKVSKRAAHAPPPACRASYGERVIAADGEAARVDCAGLRGAIKLELAVCDDGARATVLVVENAVRKGAEEVAV
jgi:hypothetical protein